MKGLKDLAVPEAIPLTPQTWAWYLLFAALALAAVFALGLFVRRRRANRYRRLALTEIDQLADQPGAWHVLPAFVKRVALQAWPREQVGPLTGAEWLAFLDESYGGNGFTVGAGRCLDDLAYRDGGDGAAAAQVVREWIRKHRA